MFCRRRARSRSGSVGGRVAAAVLAGVLATGRPVPADTATDLLALPVRQGNEPPTALGARLAGRPAVVAFWASYCPPCRAEVPVLRRIAARWRDAGVRVVGIVLDVDGAAEARRVADAWHIDYETLWVGADAWERADRLAPTGLPVAFFVSARGTVVREDRALTDRDVDTLAARLGVDALPRAPGGR